MVNKKFIQLTVLLMCIVGVGLYVYHKYRARDYRIDYNCRPQTKRYIYDYAGILQDTEEYANKYLRNIKERYTIDGIIISIPSLGEKKTIEDATVEILNNWQIGKHTNGRGVVLLLADREKKVKLEVSYELEDVFTDMFCGYIEDIQLRPYFLSGQVDIGLLAVMEEIENRAQIKHQGNYTSDFIVQMDKKLLSGGAGAKRDLLEFKQEEISSIGSKYPAGKTPRDAWEVMIQSWRDKARDPNKGVYTEITKLTYRDYQNLPDSRFERDVRTYANKSYEIIQNEGYAIVFFGNKKGWENSPFLFCRTPEGWKFDIVHQRKFIRMGPNPQWGIERANYSYIALLSRCPYWMGQDIPLDGEDIYTIENDQRLAERIRRLEHEYSNNPNNFDVLVNLGKLYVITSMGFKGIPILKKAKDISPKSAIPNKYIAIRYVESSYQYKKAIGEMKEYVKKEPSDVFGHNFLGYLYFCVDKYEQAIKKFEKALQLKPDNCYTYCKLSRCYGMLYRNTSKSEAHHNQYKRKAFEMYQKAQLTIEPNKRRIKWLQEWLKKERLLM